MGKGYFTLLVSFALGAASGSAIAWIISNEKAQRDFEQKLNSVREEYKKYYSNQTVEEHNEDYHDSDFIEDQVSGGDFNSYVSSDGDFNSYVSLAKTYDEPIDYTAFSQANDDQGPVVITSEEYSEEEEYTKLEINFFEDGESYILTDETYDPIDDISKIVSKRDLEEFISQSDEDELFTKCESKKCMYSIMKNGITWEEFLRGHPIILDTRY